MFSRFLYKKQAHFRKPVFLFVYHTSEPHIKKSAGNKQSILNYRGKCLSARLRCDFRRYYALCRIGTYCHRIIAKHRIHPLLLQQLKQFL